MITATIYNMYSSIDQETRTENHTKFHFISTYNEMKICDGPHTLKNENISIYFKNNDIYNFNFEYKID